MRLEPLFSSVLVTVEEAKEVTESGLVIPDNASHERPQTGIISAVGPEADKVKVGDKVIFRRFSPDEVKLGEETFTLLSQGDILAIVHAD
jgi:chaperonin GroES